jgi:hypothetical protein
MFRNAPSKLHQYNYTQNQSVFPKIRGEPEVLEVEDLVTRQSLKLCQKCFIDQLRLRSKGKKAAEEPHLADGAVA